MTFFIEIPWTQLEKLLFSLKNQENAVFLESTSPSQREAPLHNGRNKWGFLCPKPERTLIIDKIERKNKDVFWQQLRTFLHQNRPSTQQKQRSLPKELHDCPFLSGIIGMLSYDVGLVGENIRSQHPQETPSAILMSCHALYIINYHEKKIFWVSSHPHLPPKLETLPLPLFPFPAHTSWKADYTQKGLEEQVQNIKNFIKKGDIFQANLTMRWSLPLPSALTALEIYQALRLTSPAPFSAYFTTKKFSLLSASVERFLSLSKGRLIETRPIKGTAPLTTDPHHLAQDPKERAENIMITDLMRNDIGRVCTLGSVSVPKLCEVEEFNHLYHLVSHITGTLKEDYDAFDLLHATLPPGSVTGAPKYRALQIIDMLERTARGAYCGTLFRLSWEGNLDSSVIIRSLTLNQNTLSLGAGGGITYPSDPTKEYEEMRLKAQPLLALFKETL